MMNTYNCNKCGKEFQSIGIPPEIQLLQGYKNVVNIGEQVPQEIKNDPFLYRGFYCPKCNKAFCPSCCNMQGQICPQCRQAVLMPAYRPLLNKIKKVTQNFYPSAPKRNGGEQLIKKNYFKITIGWVLIAMAFFGFLSIITGNHPDPLVGGIAYTLFLGLGLYLAGLRFKWSTENKLSTKRFGLFSFEGRIRRTEYGVSIVILVVLSVVISLLLKPLTNAVGSDGKARAVLFIVWIIILWFITAQGAKRCHDIGKNGWFQFIPFYVFWLLTKDSDKGKNGYGPNPKGIGNLESGKDEPEPFHTEQPIITYVVSNQQGQEVHRPDSLGIRFDISKVDDSHCGYGEACWRIFWQAVDINLLAGTVLHDGDTNATPHHENVYCLSIKWTGASHATDIRKLLEEFDPYRKVAASSSFIDAGQLAKEYLVQDGLIDHAGRFVGKSYRSLPALEYVQKENASKQIATSTNDSSSPFISTSEIYKRLGVLEDAYLVRHDEDLEKSVDKALDEVAAKGEVGINALMERLYKDIKISGLSIEVYFSGDLAWNEWLKKRAIVNAFGRAQIRSVVPHLVSIVGSRSRVQQFYEILQPAAAKALGEIGDKQAIDPLHKYLYSDDVSNDTKRAIGVALEKLEGHPVSDPTIIIAKADKMDWKTEGDEVIQLLAQIDSSNMDSLTAQQKYYIWYMRGMVYKLNGDKAKAIDCFQTSLKYFNSRDAMAHNHLAELM